MLVFIKETISQNLCTQCTSQSTHGKVLKLDIHRSKSRSTHFSNLCTQCTPQSNHRKFRNLDTHIEHTHEQAYITLYRLSQTFARNALLNLITEGSENSTHTYRTYTRASLHHTLPPFTNLCTQCTPQSSHRKFKKPDTESKITTGHWPLSDQLCEMANQ